MNNTSKIRTAQNSMIRKMLFVVLFVWSSLSVFSQNSKIENTKLANSSEILLIPLDDEIASNNTNVRSSTSTMNIVSWFMGSKQSPSTNQFDETLSTKKQMINSGIAPNRLLIKTFLKKASNYNSTIA